MTRALVTGGTGFAGRALVAQLVEDGMEVHVTSHAAHSDAPGAVGVHAVDVTDAGALARLVADVAPVEIYHLAGLTRPASSDVRGFWDVNFGGARNLLDAAVALPFATRVLLVGSAYAYAPSSEPLTEEWPLLPRNHYGASKAAAEMLGRAYVSDELHVVLARPFNHSGPGQAPDFVLPAIVEQVAEARSAGNRSVTIDLGNLGSIRDIADVRDIVAGYRTVLRQGATGSTFNLGSGRGWTIRDLVELVARVAGIEIEVTQDPARMRADDLPVLVADITSVRKLGWAPSRDLETTVGDMLAHLDHGSPVSNSSESAT